MATQTAPSFWDRAGNFVFDYARHRAGMSPDVERVTDDDYIPDQVDVRTGEARAPDVNINLNRGAMGDTLRSLRWYHWGGLALAGGLAWGVATGKFKGS